MSKVEKAQPPSEINKKTWRKPTFTKLGRLQDIVHGGGGKLTVVGGDPGEGRKPSGGEP